MENAHLEAPGNSQNNPGTRWNLTVQRRNCVVVNNTILEGCEISRGIFRPLCEINSVRNFLMRKNPSAKSPPPPCSWGYGWAGIHLGTWTGPFRLVTWSSPFWLGIWTGPFPVGDMDHPLFQLGIWTSPFPVGDMDQPLSGRGYGLAPLQLGIWTSSFQLGIWTSSFQFGICTGPLRLGMDRPFPVGDMDWMKHTPPQKPVLSCWAPKGVQTRLGVNVLPVLRIS